MDTSHCLRVWSELPERVWRPSGERHTGLISPRAHRPPTRAGFHMDKGTDLGLQFEAFWTVPGTSRACLTWSKALEFPGVEELSHQCRSQPEYSRHDHG